MNRKINQIILKWIYLFTILLTIQITTLSLSADCRLCPEISAVKILLRNGVTYIGHIAINPEEEISTKPDRMMEVMRRAEKLRLYLSLDSLVDLNAQMPHVLHEKVYIDFRYKDIAKIELLENLEFDGKRKN
ncbi:MAG: hypothetical protein KA146_02455 [Leptospiraceae bacterium]|nr:hypothetical protein [Leptospiraceae bacterium]